MERFSSWRGGLLSGLSILGLVTAVRLLGLLQGLEWKVLDWSLRIRPAEPTSDRITVVVLTETDIQAAGEYPLSDGALANTLETLQSYSPRVIGVDIFRDIPVGSGHEKLTALFNQSDNLIVADKMIAPTVRGPAALPSDQIGFVDGLLDQDGALRRSLLGAIEPDTGDYRFAFTLLLASQYLAAADIPLENGRRDPETMRFGTAEVPQFRPHLGGYVGADARGNQTLLNYRAGPAPFEHITHQTLMAGEVDPTLLADRVVLLGYNAASAKDFVYVAAIPGSNPSQVPGVDVQAHAISQLLSATLDNRPFLSAFPIPVEYALILTSGSLGLLLARRLLRPLLHFVIVAIASSGLFLLLCSAVVMGWWLPAVPVVSCFFLTAVILYPAYQMQARLSSAIQQRQQLIDQTFDTIHNGPLHTLSGLLRAWPEDSATPGFNKAALHQLNQELRSIYETMRTEMLLPQEQLVLNQQTVSLDGALKELLYEVYQNTVQREQHFFQSLIHITQFEDMADGQLSPHRKGELGRFLEEILLNVSKYAVGATRIRVSCLTEADENIIRVVDNGQGELAITPHEGHGTRHALQLARKLGGQFNRQVVSPKGVLCELRWPVTVGKKRWLWGKRRV